MVSKQSSSARASRAFVRRNPEQAVLHGGAAAARAGGFLSILTFFSSSVSRVHPAE